MTGRATARRYTAVAIVLHWAIAAAVLGNLVLGWWMHDAIEFEDTQARAVTAYQLHKSLGLTVLLLTVIRLGWRWLHPVPAMPAGMAPWERVAARAVHYGFYVLLAALPLSGWLFVSTQWRGDTPLNVPTLWFGLFEVPHLLGLNEAPAAERRELSALSGDAHEVLGWIAAALLVLHVLAALKHHFVDRDEVLASMLPVVRTGGMLEAGSPERGRRPILLAGTLLILLSVVAVAWTLLRTPAEAPAMAGDVRITSAPGGWIVDPATSEIAFIGQQSGGAFRGRFTRWHADIRFDRSAPEQGRVVVRVATASATDGVPLHDETLPMPEWFDAARHPEATFRSSRIAARPDGGYRLEGTLAIKDRTLSVPPLSVEARGDELLVAGRFEIDRAEANLGMESDPGGEYVSRKITVEVRARVTPPPPHDGHDHAH